MISLRKHIEATPVKEEAIGAIYSEVILKHFSVLLRNVQDRLRLVL